MKFAIVLVALILSAAVAEPKQDRTVFVPQDDREMSAAIEHARATLDDFLKLAANPPPGASGFRLKVRFSDAHGVEHMWVLPFEASKTGFTGVLADSPDVIAALKLGERVAFPRSDISDWGYVLDGKQVGSFTVCVALKHMSKQEADAYRHDYGFQC